MNPIEAAAAIDRDVLLNGTSVDVAREVILAWVRAAVGCPTCKGIGKAWWCAKEQRIIYTDPVTDPCPRPSELLCNREHVKLTVLGVTIYAARDKCWWVCYGFETIGRNDWICQAWTVMHGPEGHEDCGWQPRMDVLLGGE